MLSINLNRISRNTLPKSLRALNFSDDKNKSDKGEKKKKLEKDSDKDDNKKKEAANRLNKLLASMQTDDNLTLVKNVIVQKAGGRRKIREKHETEEKEKKPKTVTEAIKDVAEAVGGDVKQTESELLTKLRNYTERVEADKDEKNESPNALNLSELIVGMKIDRDAKPPKDAPSRGQYVRKAISARERQLGQQQREKFDGRRREDFRQHRQPAEYTVASSVKLFDSKPLDIFKNKDDLQASPDILKTWDRLYQRELKLSITHPPKNYFEKMALWTEQEKLWRFPVDNEQGLEEERKIDFSDHIFLEQHLEGWCPTKGPVRHFMELVCVGLSKNPYITAQDKKDHILWYRDYFENKKELLKELIIEKQESENTGATKSVEP